METFVQIVLILSLLKYCLKAALTGRFGMILLYGMIASLFAMVIYPFVITQPVNIISELLTNQKIVTDIAVVTTIEAVLGIFISILLLDNYFLPRKQRKKTIKILKVLPGILVFPAIAYFELMFFKMNSGVDFMLSAIIYASILFFSITMCSLFIKSKMKHESIKLELKIIINLGILVIGLLINSMVADYNLSNSETIIEWKPLLVLCVIIGVMFTAGVLCTRFNCYTRIKKVLKIK